MHTHHRAVRGKSIAMFGSKRPLRRLNHLALPPALSCCERPSFHRLYGAFYFSYFFLAVTYLGLCFWHFGQEGDSWAYLWATLALWLLSVLVRLFYHSQALKLDSPWSTRFPTCLRALPGIMTRIDILVLTILIVATRPAVLPSSPLALGFRQPSFHHCFHSPVSKRSAKQDTLGYSNNELFRALSRRVHP